MSFLPKLPHPYDTAFVNTKTKRALSFIVFFYTKLNATHTPDIELINVAYLGAARRSYNVSKKPGVFSRFYRANLLLSYDFSGSWCYRGLKNHWMTIHCFRPVSGWSTLIKSHCGSPLLFLTVFKFLLPERFYTFSNYWSRHLVSRGVYRGGIQGFRKSRNTTARAETLLHELHRLIAAD